MKISQSWGVVNERSGDGIVEMMRWERRCSRSGAEGEDEELEYEEPLSSLKCQDRRKGPEDGDQGK